MASHSPAQRTVAVLLITLMLSGCAVRQREPLQPGPGGYPQPGGFNQFSRQQEIQLGHQAAQEADAQLPLVPQSHQVSQYVERIGQRLAAQLPKIDPPFRYDFRVVNMKDINAFALPGGPIRLNLGIVQAAENEAEVAGVLAHEIAHVYMRHGTQNASRAMVAQIPAAILGGILGGGSYGQLARLGLSFGLSSVFLRYSRDAESEADYVGAKLLYETGYDPQAMVTFFRKLEKEGGRGGPEFLASHPNPGNRAEAVSQAIAELPPRDFTAPTGRFNEIKQAASTLKPLSAEEVARQQAAKQPRIESVSARDVMPSGSYQTLNHQLFRIQYPSNWQVFGQRDSAVTIAPRAGVSEQQIAYGVVVSGYQPRQRESLERSTEQIFSMLRQSNPQLQAAGQLRRTNFNGLPANVVTLQGPSPLVNQQGQPIAERDLLVTVQRPDGIVVWLLFIAPQPHFDDLQPAFERMMSSLQVG